MFDNPIYNYPIPAIMNAIGARKGFKDMWYSPLRDEKEPSFHVNQERNLWYDHGLGQGGTNVALVQLVKRCSKEEAEAFISRLEPSLATKQPEKKSAGSEIVKVGPISSYYLQKYLSSRKIPLDLAQKYCKEITVRNKDRGQNFTLIGFENNVGGYAMKAPSGFKQTNRAGITTLDTSGEISVQKTSDSVAVFEGFFDFLSWQVMQEWKTPSCDVVVLNSVNNLDKASAYIEAHDKILGFLDRDEAGRKCWEKIRSSNPGKETKDMSALYRDHKDLNEMLMASKGYGQGIGHKH